METLGDAWRSEGIQEGMAQGIYLTAKNMLAEGDGVEKIARCTGLSIEEINKMRSEQ